MEYRNGWNVRTKICRAPDTFEEIKKVITVKIICVALALMNYINCVKRR